jgi:hypothetical protein
MCGGDHASCSSIVNRIRKRRRRGESSQKEQFQWDREKSVRQASGQKDRHWNRIIYGTLAAILAVGVLIVVVVLRYEHLEVDVRETRTESVITDVSEPPAKPEARSEAVITELLGFINDPTHDARAERMYGQADALKHLVTYYDQRGNALPRKVVNPSVNAVKFKDRELLLVAFQDEKGRAWSAPFEWDHSSYRLHWEAMTGFGEISWHDFFENRPNGYFKMRANFFLPEKEVLDPVATDHVVVLMSHPDLARPASVLVRGASEIHRQLARYPRATDIPGIVEIHWPDGSANRPVLTRWFQRDWLR